MNKLNLHFIDTKREIEVDLNKNTVFFGNNGQGKTRILKTINSLYLFAKEEKTVNLSKIIDSMNLKTLKINNVNYNKLFSVNKSYIEAEVRKINVFHHEYRRFFRKLYISLQEIPIENFYMVQGRLKTDKIMSYLERILNDSMDHRYNGFNRWLNDAHFLITRLRHNKQNMMEFNNIELHEVYSTYVEEAFNLISFLKEKYQILTIEADYEEEFISSIEKNKENILKNLSNKSAYYITTDNIEIKKINNKIEEFIDKINNKLKCNFWNKDNRSNDNMNYMEIALNDKEKLYRKIDKFNSIISKYAKIEVCVQKSGDLMFKKNNEEMTFEKLSSGEKKVSFLFLEILFNDVDIYLIDEPELSLSLNFQNKIITDLHILTKGKKLFIATHAPYIYEDFMAINGNTSKEV
ncbi:AAA family ATPase [Bacillus safensis]|uniref:AAA family ATPase n=1 Tax=Bacillus safensis TaxID=561879 RepID=UPI001C222455|nr:AAA family ATPase [Bacillus safensis]MBU8604910.1 AAA family ATPase [Bacillus safensis]MBU8615635.1 AAA family ATPase [Bacillus safensis]MBU8626763.1 AAA family ATPase [Bacillus safensis]MCY7525859.1 AAA family ATPase [Bacillus safensis]MDF1458948.1 AAA family ATPase [Bacillus safensis]